MVLGVELGGGEFGHGCACGLHVYAAEPKISAVKDSSLDILSHSAVVAKAVEVLRTVSHRRGMTELCIAQLGGMCTNLG